MTLPTLRRCATASRAGALNNDIWSVSEDDGRRSVNQMLIQPTVNYNFPDAPGRYLTVAPVMVR